MTCEPAQTASAGPSDHRTTEDLLLRSGFWADPRAALRPAPLSASFVQTSGVACASEYDCLLVGYSAAETRCRPSLGRAVGWACLVHGHSLGRALGGWVPCRRRLSAGECSHHLLGGRPETVPKGWALVLRDPSPRRALGRELVRLPSTVPREVPGDYPELRAVSCAAVTACQAVGSRGSGADEALVLTEGWNGSSWSAELSPSPLYGFQSLTGVACPSERDAGLSARA